MKTETVKGFKDFTGEEAEKREFIRKILVESFESYGFEPSETPIIEFKEFVQGENVRDEAVSDIFRLEDRGGRELALRYEFTFQLKRLMEGKKIPYKRYTIGPVFRDEPVTGNRFRQFTQCDIDTISSDVNSEAEVLAVVNRVLEKLEIESVIFINNRKLLNEILEKEKIKLEDRDKVICEIDKMDKLEEKEVYNNLKKYGAQNLIKIFNQPEKSFEKYESYSEIKNLKNYCKIYGFKIKFNPALARGLSYYNGSVFEIKTKEMKETICGGGSYMFNEVQSTGLSFGLDRLSMLLKEDFAKIERIMVLSINQEKEAIKLAEKLRSKGLNCYYSNAKISKALDYANSKKISKVIFVGEKELKENKVKVKNMESGEEQLVSMDEFN
ncbi:hypothetical protein COT60_01920 [Candidatus Pacearchaeota archaeon CG09_land_8_20_14_0_10_30_9]|nr:MAG: hypothetical protein COT60_01920 [Candidatus Pacearchaeota archaeon CG09_land_8_20_14_0_10_30_9]